jgi:translation initiation factor 2 beta subunit (eIF-2beta)/eIF-5
MNLRLLLAGIYIPSFMKKQKLAELVSLTAQAFGSQIPDLKNHNYEACLQQYALFTRAETERIIDDPIKRESIKKQLFKNAYQLGVKLRRDFRIKSIDESLTLSRILYRLIEIDFQSNFNGKIIIKKCFFSNWYTAEICDFISALDEGILTGISGGGKLSFSQRITDGKDCCKAHFTFKENLI